MKKVTTFLLALAMALTLVAALGACNGRSENSAPGTTSPANSSKVSSKSDEGSSEPAKDSGEITNIVFAYRIFSAGSLADMNLVEDEINKITEPEIGVHVTITPIQSSAYDQQITLMTTSKETLDLISSGGGNLSVWAGEEKIIPLNELLDNQGQDIKDLLGNYLKATTIGGQIYAIPTIRDLCRGSGLMYDVELAEECSVDMNSVKSLEDFTDVFAKIQTVKGADFPCLIVASTGQSFINQFITVDQLNDFNGVLMNFGLDNTKVTFFEETEEYKKLVTLLGDWYKAGYIQKDIATSQEDKYTMLQQDIGFCYPTNCKPGIAETATRSVGRPMNYVQIHDYFANTAQVASIDYSISVNSLAPEKTMEFLNMLYSDERVATLLSAGIEGKHYVLEEDGQMAFPEGVTGENSTYFPNVSWAVGNQFATPTWNNDPEDLWDRQQAANESAKKSLALGFAFQSDKVANEITAISNARKQYQLQIENGACDVEALLPEYIQALKDAGMEKVIAEKQSQLDAWLAEQ